LYTHSGPEPLVNKRVAASEDFDEMGGTIGSSIAPGKSLSYREGVSSLYFHGGPWSKSASGYLGLKFFIEGNIHYGWARLNHDAKPTDHRGSGF